jgi:hypothetical protein
VVPFEGVRGDIKSFLSDSKETPRLSKEELKKRYEAHLNKNGVSYKNRPK